MGLYRNPRRRTRDCNGLSGVFPANRCKLLGATDGIATQVHIASTVPAVHDQESTCSNVHHADDVQRQQPQAVAHLPSEHSYEVVHDFDDTVQAYKEPSHHWDTFDDRRPSPSSVESGPFQDAAGLPGGLPANSLSPPPEPSDGGSDGDEVLLPPNWSATTNAKGRLYYYNVMTKETSWKMPTASPTTPSGPTLTEQETQSKMVQNTSVSPQKQYDDSLDGLPQGWNSARDEDGSMYFFNSSTGETTWDKPTGSGSPTDSRLQSPKPKNMSVDVKSSPPEQARSSMSGMMSPTMVSRSNPKRQSSVDDNMLQSQLLSLSLSEEELDALTLNQLPAEHIQRKGSLRVKSQKVSSNATISSWKDYWVVVYKGFLLFYRDDNGAIKGSYALKSSAESLAKIRHATQVKPSGCFDAEKVSVEVATKEQGLTKKKNVFHITPGTSVRLLLQDAVGADEKAWVADIQASLASRHAEENSGLEEPYLIQVLRHQTSGTIEASGLKMNKKIEEKDQKNTSKSHNPLKMDKARGIRNMVAQGMHVPRRKSAQDERLRLPAEDTLVEEPNSSPPASTTSNHGATSTPTSISTNSHQRASSTATTTSTTGSRPSTSKRTSSRDQSKDLKREQEHEFSPVSSPPAETVGSPNNNGNTTSGGSGSALLHGSNLNKVKFSNLSRNFFSKDKDKDKEKEKEKEREKEKEKEKEREKEKNKDKQKDRNSKKPPVKSTQVFGGSLVVEAGRTVPKVVELCVKTIEARGLSTPGIYRVSGHMSSIQNLKRAFNEGLDVDKLVAKEPDVNTIAALLKLYFRELHEPLMLFDFYPSFIAAADIEEYNEKLYTIKSLVHALPEPNFNTLQYLMNHLGHVQDQYSTTKMDSANLAICFAPNLLRQQVDDLTSIINTGKQSSIVDTLIEQREWIFDPYPEDEDEEQEEQEEQEREVDNGSNDYETTNLAQHQQQQQQFENEQLIEDQYQQDNNNVFEREAVYTSPPSHPFDDAQLSSSLATTPPAHTVSSTNGQPVLPPRVLSPPSTEKHDPLIDK
ncbi:hypothetical protein BGZ94_008614 [Podila epigama]|nr:hypothetical protein BGZ94_008614 [Podila epigama]